MKQSIQELEEELRALERAWTSPENTLAQIRTQHSLGLLHRLQLQFNKAEPYYKTALALATTFFGERHLQTAVHRNYLAGLYFAAGKYEDAEKLLAKNLQLYEELLGPEDRATAITLYALAIVKRHALIVPSKPRKRAVKVAEAEFAPTGRWKDYYERSVRLMNIDVRQLSMQDSNDLFLALIRLSHDAFADERFEEAEELFRHSLLMELQEIWPQHPLIGNSYRLLADVCRSYGLTPQAEALYKTALSIKEKGYGPSDEKVAATAFAFGTLLLENGRNEEAEPLLKRSCDIYRSNGAFPPLLANSLRAYADVLTALNQESEARNCIEEAQSIYDKHGHKSTSC